MSSKLGFGPFRFKLPSGQVQPVTLAARNCGCFGRLRTQRKISWASARLCQISLWCRTQWWWWHSVVLHSVVPHSVVPHSVVDLVVVALSGAAFSAVVVDLVVVAVHYLRHTMLQVPDISVVMHMFNGDFQRWLVCRGEFELADQIGAA